MAGEAGDEKKAVVVEAKRPETAEELLLRAAELLEKRGGARAKSYASAAADVRELVAWLEGRK